VLSSYFVLNYAAFWFKDIVYASLGFIPIVCEVKNKEPLNVNYDGNGTKLIEADFLIYLTE